MTDRSRNISAAIEYAAKVFQKYRVLQDCFYTTATYDTCRCFTCNTLIPRDRNLHGGHWKKRSNHSVLFEKANCNGQCRVCNIDQHGNMRVYEQKMIEKYGQAEHDRIVILARQVKCWTFEELDKMTENWRTQIKIVESRKSKG